MQTAGFPAIAYSSFLTEIIGLVGVLNRRAELQQLIHWSKRKRLSHPQKLYQFRLQDEEIRLNRYLVRYPAMTIWTCRFYGLWQSLAPKPRYYRRGSAAKYRTNHR